MPHPPSQFRRAESRQRWRRVLALGCVLLCGASAAGAAEPGVALPFENGDFAQALQGWTTEDFGAAGGWIEPDQGHAVFSLAGDAAVLLLQSTGCIDLPSLLATAGMAHGEHEFRVQVRYRVLEGSGQLRARLRTGFAGDLPEDLHGCIGPHTGVAASYADVGASAAFALHDSGWMAVDSGPLAMVDIGFARGNAGALLAEVDSVAVQLRTVPVIFGGDGFESVQRKSADSGW